MGEASKVWLHHSLTHLNMALKGNLNCYIGKSSKIIHSLFVDYEVDNIYWNSCYEPWHIKQEEEILKLCKAHQVNYNSYNSNYLWEPNDILKKDGTYYKVFSAYKKKSQQFDQFPWKNNQKYLSAWQRGLTGYPIIDAGMREL